jgi:hypothetical protein
MRNVLITAAGSFAASLASAHPGHGPSGAHLHSSDLFGLGILAIFGAVLWVARNK